MESKELYVKTPKRFLEELNIEIAFLLAEICGFAANSKDDCCKASNKYLSHGKCTDNMIQKRLKVLKDKNKIWVKLNKETNQREGIYPFWKSIGVSKDF